MYSCALLHSQSHGNVLFKQMAARCCKKEISSFCSPCQPQIIDKGIPEGAMPGIAGRQVQLKDDENMIPGLLNGQGNKVSLLLTLMASLCNSGCLITLMLLEMSATSFQQHGLNVQVRLTFKPAEQQVWIGSAASTQKGACVPPQTFSKLLAVSCCVSNVYSYCHCNVFAQIVQYITARSRRLSHTSLRAMRNTAWWPST